MSDSRSLPDLEKVPGKQNWVDHAGGLPNYIERIAKHLHSEKGMTISHAIASAVNTVKRWAAGGDGVKPDTQAKAAKAVAEWEKKKASAKATASQQGAEQMVDLHGIQVADWERDLILTAEQEINGEVVVDDDAYRLHLSAERARLGLDLAITFDPNLHPRDFKGRFRDTVRGLKTGESVKLPDGTTVKSLDSGYKIGDSKVTSAREAADAALRKSAKSDSPDSIGGTIKHRSAEDAAELDDAIEEMSDNQGRLTPDQAGELAEEFGTATSSITARAARIKEKKKAAGDSELTTVQKKVEPKGFKIPPPQSGDVEGEKAFIQGQLKNPKLGKKQREAGEKRLKELEKAGSPAKDKKSGDDQENMLEVLRGEGTIEDGESLEFDGDYSVVPSGDEGILQLLDPDGHVIGQGDKEDVAEQYARARKSEGLSGNVGLDRPGKRDGRSIVTNPTVLEAGDTFFYKDENGDEWDGLVKYDGKRDGPPYYVELVGREGTGGRSVKESPLNDDRAYGEKGLDWTQVEKFVDGGSPAAGEDEQGEYDAFGRSVDPAADIKKAKNLEDVKKISKYDEGKTKKLYEAIGIGDAFTTERREKPDYAVVDGKVYNRSGKVLSDDADDYIEFEKTRQQLFDLVQRKWDEKQLRHVLGGNTTISGKKVSFDDQGYHIGGKTYWTPAEAIAAFGWTPDGKKKGRDLSQEVDLTAYELHLAQARADRGL